jgi:LemA protein
MKKSIIVLIVIAILAFLFYSFFRKSFNTMVESEEAVTAQWAQVENVYQRRADLIPNLVNTVKGFAAQEQEVLTGVVEARAKASSININADNMTEANMQAFQQAQEGLSGALSRLMVVVERYPDLKSNQNFLELQAQLEGTENRIAVERMKFNETTRTYNTFIRKFPQTLIARMMGFEGKPYFEATAGASTAPVVEF